jgi:hypothetical protein
MNKKRGVQTNREKIEGLRAIYVHGCRKTNKGK